MRPAPASAILLALLAAVAAPSTACATATAGGAQDGATGGGETATGDSEAAEAPGIGEEGVERTIAGRRFVRRGENWYLESGGRRFRVLPDSLSLQFQDGATEEERRDFLASRGFEVVRSNRLGILDVRTGPDRHAVDWLAELTGNEILALVDVHTEGAYEEE
ncbi:MAG TPA: hypothetical protein VF121_00360 [Thermoanaerobaculia bacterium]|nr:hypothetical protein [Thermoanaerobaculia bacterium]